MFHHYTNSIILKNCTETNGSQLLAVQPWGMYKMTNAN